MSDPIQPDVDIRVSATRSAEHVLLDVLKAVLPGLPTALESVELIDGALKFRVAAPAGAKAVVQVTASITEG